MFSFKTNIVDRFSIIFLLLMAKKVEFLVVLVTSLEIEKKRKEEGMFK